MTLQVTLNGTTYSDDGSVGLGMADGAFRENFIPMCGDLITEMAGHVTDATDEVTEATNQAAIATAQANIAIGAAASTVTGPGSTGTSTTSLTVGLGLKNLTIQTGKTLYKGMPIAIAASASPADAMYGPLVSYDPASGAMVVKVDAVHMETAGTFITSASWTVSLTGAAAVWALINELKGAPIASAGTINLNAATGNYLHLTGSAGPVTSVTLAQGAEREVVLDGTPTFTHSAFLSLPTGTNITGAVGDVIKFRGEGNGVTRVTSYTRANGDALFTRKQFRTLTYLSMSGTYVAPANGIVRATLRGADGSGAVALCISDQAASAAASGAGAGGLTVKTLRVKAGDTFTVILASGGAQAQTSTPGSRVNGNAGGSSSITGPNTNMSAGGGSGGVGVFAASGPITAPGAGGGDASGGDVNNSGGGSGSASVTNGSGTVATGGGAVGWNSPGHSSGNATVTAPSGNMASAASGGAGTGGASGSAATTIAALQASTGGAGAAGESADAINTNSAPGQGLPSMLVSTPLSLIGAGNSGIAGGGGNGVTSQSSNVISTAGGQLAGGGAACCVNGYVGGSIVTASGNGGGSTGGAATRQGTSGTTTVTAQAGANAFAIFEWAEA